MAVEAIRDAYPPNSSHGVLLRWWLSYLIVPPVVGIAVIIAALAGNTATLWIMIALAVLTLGVPVVFGWRLVIDLGRTQQDNVSASQRPAEA